MDWINVWKVQFKSVKVQIDVAQMIRLGQLTRADQEVIRLWISQIEMHGPQSIKSDQRWADHELEHEWAGYRSSSFSRRGRIIYKIENKLVMINIARITTKHDYRGEK